MTGPSDPRFGPYQLHRFFSVETAEIACGMAFMTLRFVFDGMGPRIEMRPARGDPWTPAQIYENFRLAPEDLPYLTQEDLDLMIELFKRGVRLMDPGTTFLYSPILAPVLR